MRGLLVLAMVALVSCTSSWSAPNDRFSTNPAAILISGRTDISVQQALERVDTLIVRRGDGGSVSGMMSSLDYLRSHGNKRVIIDGACYSACTLLLGVPQSVTFTDRAEFFFHSASTSSCRNGVRVSARSDSSNSVMLAVFSLNIQQWILDNHGFASFEFVRLSNPMAQRLLPHMHLNSLQVPHYTVGPVIAQPKITDLFPPC